VKPRIRKLLKVVFLAILGILALIGIGIVVVVIAFSQGQFG
jgi:hypothetical protein